MNNKQNSLQINRHYYNARFGNDNSLNFTAEENLRKEIILKYLSNLYNEERKGVDILDFGCGNARISNSLKPFGKVTAIDLAEKAVEKARRTYPNITFQVGNASSKAVIDHLGVSSFDCIISSEVVEHLDDQDSYFINIYRLLKPGGYMIMTTPNKRWFDQYFAFGKRESTQPVENWLTLDEIRGKTRNANLELLFSCTFRSAWIFEFQTTGLISCIGHRYFRKFLEISRLKNRFISLADKFGLGLNQLIIAQKN